VKIWVDADACFVVVKEISSRQRNDNLDGVVKTFIYGMMNEEGRSI